MGVSGVTRINNAHPQHRIAAAQRLNRIAEID
jgi:hypothetical protein